MVRPCWATEKELVKVLWGLCLWRQGSTNPFSGNEFAWSLGQGGGAGGEKGPETEEGPDVRGWKGAGLRAAW